MNTTTRGMTQEERPATLRIALAASLVDGGPDEREMRRLRDRSDRLTAAQRQFVRPR